MPRSLPIPLWILSLTLVALSLSGTSGQDRTIVPPAASSPAHANESSGQAGISESTASQPAVTIGGPFGVVIGGGHGVRFGGPNGAQFGGGAGARFGGRDGVQFGGGEGVRIGPSGESANQDPAAGEAAPDAMPTTDGNPPPIAIHHPSSARGALHLRVNGQDLEIPPGETIALSGDQRMSVQVVNPNGRTGLRRSLSPGHYTSRETRRGWTLARAEPPSEPLASEPLRRLPETLEFNSPAIEPAPADDDDHGTSGE